MSSTMNSLLVQQHQGDRDRTVGHAPRRYREPRTCGDGAPTRWISLAHAPLNQAKLASPRRAAASQSSAPCRPDRGTILTR
jgi:hypothetical protein